MANKIIAAEATEAQKNAFCKISTDDIYQA